MKTNQIIFRPMGQFKVEQRTKDGMFNATSLLKQKTFNKIESVCDYFKSMDEKQSETFCANYLDVDEKGNVWMPFFIFVDFVEYLQPNHFADAHLLCMKDGFYNVSEHSANDGIEELFSSFSNDFGGINKAAKKVKTYILRDKSCSLFKIGKTSNLSKRFSAIKTANPNIEPFAYLGSDIEKELHTELSQHRIIGEWFNLSNELLLSIVRKYNFTMADS